MGRVKGEERHIPQLDGLRGVAILLVLMFHISRVPPDMVHTLAGRWLNGVSTVGWAGVDLFFVLSGFLITRILLDAKDASNYFKVFYMRRVLRILPIYYLSLILVFWVLPLLAHHSAFFYLHRPGDFGPAEQLWYWFSLVNIPTSYVYPFTVPMLAHYWTLSVEEQFYFVWPAVVYWLNERWLVWVSVLGMVCALILRNLPWVQAINAQHFNFVYRLTPFRIDTLLAGALLAVAYKHYRHQRFYYPAAWGVLAVSVAGLMLWGNKVFSAGQVTYTWLAIFFGAVLAVSMREGWPGKIFLLRPLRSLGKYSYCIYLIHPLLLQWCSIPIAHLLHGRLLVPGHPYASTVVRGYGLCVVVYGVAWLSWRWIEEPMLRLKKYYRYQFRQETAATELQGI